MSAPTFELLITESQRDFGYTIVTATINGKVVGLRRMERPAYKRMKNFCPSGYETFISELTDEALNNYYREVHHSGY